MDASHLLDAAEAANKLASIADGFHPDHKLATEVVHMRLVITLGALYMKEMADHLGAGLSQLDALIATLEGNTPLSPDTVKSLEDDRQSRLQ